ncbi:DNA-directed RNA polymerase subunit alpha [Nitratiruptor sp. YY08-26]|uniref:DNA-directed RNA polymerase subunit alpha n=1 Tax=unclassified Nitratiruptor TaxID=2624044 RepID=UPI001915D0C4|nr:MULTISPECIES: DNA-directed RNA polymerase subunit alpha [unclassified Nitratiruptor]BCD61439.1 DNA-directed RNA polymerase subunit alpha [Nitratiruptor sp. YY08-13]BCD65373.1 DNA-directed RNA polymerase subunit alpha [Nitratiruptor sp. YY08-26]
MNRIKVTPSVPTNLEVEKIKENHIRLNVYPYESGYAISIAHPLRRLLLSSTVGYAPVGIKIEGVQHEFDSVRGMLEDVAEFIINLKNIRFKIIDEEKDNVTVSFSFSGPKELYGKDLSNDEIEVVTPDNFLATLNEDAQLNFEVIVKKGIGYVPSEAIRESLPEGFIPLDAFFTPVKKAVYTIENVLVEDNPNYEKIVFDIETDGQVDPVKALKMALDVLYNQLAIFNNDITLIEGGSAKNGAQNEQIFFEKIDALGLSARSYNSLQRAGVEYVGELLLMDKDELKNIKNLGKKSLDEIEERLEDLDVDVESMTPQMKSTIAEKIQQIKSKG